MVTQLPHAEPHVGQVLAPRNFTLTKPIIEDYLAGLGLEARAQLPLLNVHVVNEDGQCQKPTWVAPAFSA